MLDAVRPTRNASSWLRATDPVPFAYSYCACDAEFPLVALSLLLPCDAFARSVSGSLQAARLQLLLLLLSSAFMLLYILEPASIVVALRSSSLIPRLLQKVKHVAGQRMSVQRSHRRRLHWLCNPAPGHSSAGFGFRFRFGFWFLIFYCLLLFCLWTKSTWNRFWLGGCWSWLRLRLFFAPAGLPLPFWNISNIFLIFRPRGSECCFECILRIYWNFFSSRHSREATLFRYEYKLFQYEYNLFKYAHNLSIWI